VSEGEPGGGLRPDLAPLRSSRGFRLLFASRTVTALGPQAGEVALLVQAKQLTAATALLSMSQNASFLLGSALGGVLAVAPGPWLVYGIDGAGFAASFGLSPDLYAALACLIAAGAADMISGIFRSTLWNQTIPDVLRGRLAGIELLSYGMGPPAGQLRSGVVANLVSTRFSLVSGGLFCLCGVVAVCGLLPHFVRYKSEPA
jgi:hypothetical protein